jgi:hypothetical protein
MVIIGFRAPATPVLYGIVRRGPTSTKWLAPLIRVWVYGNWDFLPQLGINFPNCGDHISNTIALPLSAIAANNCYSIVIALAGSCEMSIIFGVASTFDTLLTAQPLGFGLVLAASGLASPRGGDKRLEQRG